MRVDVRVDARDGAPERRVRRDDSHHHAYRLSHFEKYPRKARAFGLKPDKAQKKINKIEKKQRKLEKKQRKLEKKRDKRRHR